jgi:hypothetical protein
MALVKIKNCDCLFEEHTKQGSTCSYVLVEECSTCAAAREAEATKQTKLTEIQDKKNYLTSTDYKVIRQRDQLAAEATTTLTSEEYQQLLSDRQAARARINELEAQL